MANGIYRHYALSPAWAALHDDDVTAANARQKLAHAQTLRVPPLSSDEMKQLDEQRLHPKSISSNMHPQIILQKRGAEHRYNDLSVKLRDLRHLFQDETRNFQKFANRQDGPYEIGETINDLDSLENEIIVRIKKGIADDKLSTKQKNEIKETKELTANLRYLSQEIKLTVGRIHIASDEAQFFKKLGWATRGRVQAWLATHLSKQNRGRLSKGGQAIFWTALFIVPFFFMTGSGKSSDSSQAKKRKDTTPPQQMLPPNPQVSSQAFASTMGSIPPNLGAVN